MLIEIVKIPNKRMEEHEQGEETCFLFLVQQKHWDNDGLRS